MKKPDSLSDNIIFLISDAQRIIYNKIIKVFRESNAVASPEQFAILTQLWYSDGASQQTIADALNRDKATITRVLSNMEKKSMIVRIPDKSDGRQRLIYLTEKGKQEQKKLMELSAQVYIDALKDIEGNDLEIGINVIKRVTSNIQK